MKIMKNGSIELTRDDVEKMGRPINIRVCGNYEPNPYWTEECYDLSRNLQAWCDGKNGRSSVRLAHWRNVVDAVNAVRQAVEDLRVAWKDVDGTSWTIDPNAQRFPSAYTRYYTPMSSHVVVTVRGPRFRVDIVRGECASDRRARVLGGMSESLAEAVRRAW